jgi:hypothetical protein
MRRYRKYGLLLGAILAVGAGLVWLIERPKTITAPLSGRIALDDTPFGDVAFNSDRLTAEFRSTLAPGRYAVDAPVGRFTLEVPAGAAVAGNMDLRVTDRGEEAGRRWVAVAAERSRLVFTPPVKVTDPRGVTADLDRVSFDENGASVEVQPAVGQSVTNWVAARVWSAPRAEGVTANPVQEVTVSAGRLALRDGGRLGWHGAAEGDASSLGIGPGSEVRVRDLAVTGSGEITRGHLSVTLAVGPGSHVRTGGIGVRSDGGALAAELTVRRSAEGTRVALVPGTVASLRLDKVRVTAAPDLPEVAADRLQAVFDQATWEQRPASEVAVAGRSRVEVAGLTVPGSPLAGLRVESVTATVTGGAEGVRLDGIRVRVPKAVAVATAKAALPKAFPLADQPLAGNVLDLFQDVKLAGVTVEPGAPQAAFEKGQVVFSARPVVRGTVTALGRHDIVTMRVQEVDGPLGTKLKAPLPHHEVHWVPRVALPFTVPLAISGRATVEVVPGPTLADTRLRVKTICESVTVGEPAVEGLPEPLKPAVPLAAKFRDQIRVDGKTVADHVKGLATREDLLPLFGPSPKGVAALQRVILREPVISESGDDLVLTGSVSF